LENFKLSPNFTFFEMTTTNHRTYLDKNRAVVNDKDLLSAGYAVCSTSLEPIRLQFGVPVIINSGYRCYDLNKAIGGSKTSQHQLFQAADFYVAGVDLLEVFEWIWKESYLRWGQLILEGISQGNPTWIHISLSEPWYHKSQEVKTWSASRGYHTL